MFTTVYALFFKRLCASATIFPRVWNCLLYPDRTDDGNHRRSTNSRWFTLTAASETLAQSHFRRTGWESQEFIYSLYPLNPFHSHRGLWKDHQSVSHRAITDRQMLSQSYSHSDSYLTTFPGEWVGNSIMRKPIQTPHRLGIKPCDAAEPPWHLYREILFF